MAFQKAVRMGGLAVKGPAVYVRKDSKEFYLNSLAMALVVSNNGNKAPRCVLVWWDPDTKKIGLSFHSDLTLKDRNSYHLTMQHAGPDESKAAQFCCRWLQDRLAEANVFGDRERLDVLLEECTEPGCEPEYTLNMLAPVTE